MAIKNNQNIDLETLQKKLKKRLPDYEYEINGNALTIAYQPNTKLNIVQMGEEFWTVEAVPFNFKMVIVIFALSTFSYWVIMQGWSWGINIALFIAAFIALGYIANWLYGLMYAKNYQKFKPKVVKVVKELVE